ncbi:MAG: hypothetical protein JWN14_4178, partial [Chthonomonadales bacterium]|nr:hypothetical protein [Chthonomonadales bacterium]
DIAYGIGINGQENDVSLRNYRYLYLLLRAS